MTTITEIPPALCMSDCCRRALQTLKDHEHPIDSGCLHWLEGVGFVEDRKITKEGLKALETENA